MWCKWYIKTNQGKLTIEGTLVFDEDNIYNFDPKKFETGSNSSKGNMKYYATINSNIDDEKLNFFPSYLILTESRTLGLTSDQVLKPQLKQQA